MTIRGLFDDVALDDASAPAGQQPHRLVTATPPAGQPAARHGVSGLFDDVAPADTGAALLKDAPAERSTFAGLGQVPHALMAGSADLGDTIAQMVGRPLAQLNDFLEERDRRAYGYPAPEHTNLEDADYFARNFTEPAQAHWQTNRQEMGGTARFADTAAHVVGKLPAMIGLTPLFLADAGFQRSKQAIDQGQDLRTAEELGGTALAINAAGLKVPGTAAPLLERAGLPMTNTWAQLAARLGMGAATQPAIGAGGDVVDKAILAGNGYQAAADAIHPLDPERRLHDAVLGLGFGVQDHVLNPHGIEGTGDQGLRNAAVHPDTPADQRIAALLELAQRGQFAQGARGRRVRPTVTSNTPPPAPPAPPAAPPPADGGDLGAMLGQILAGGERPAPPTPAPVDASSVAAGPAPATTRADDILPATPPPPPSREEQLASRPGIQAPGREVEPRTPAGTPVKARYALVNVHALTASHDAAGAVNPDFPQALQPRDRERKASQAQIQQIAGNLDPHLLGEAPTTADGAPLVGPDGVVESGNGRTLALRAAYASGRADHYRDWLKANAHTFGLDPAKVDAISAPMLVRVRQGAATPAERVAIARESNQSTVARMGASERAQADAAALTDEDLASYKPNEDGSVLGAGNQDFLNRFAQRLPASERGDLLTADGRWSAEMARRVQAAVFAKAYASPDVLALHAEEASPDVRNILTALNRAAPHFAALGAEGAPVREAVAEAVRQVRAAKASGQALEEALRQGDLLGGTSTPAQRIASVFGANARSAAKLTDFLEELAGVSAANQDNGSGALFGDAPSPEHALEGAVDAAQRRVAEPGTGYSEMRAHAQAVRSQLGLFGHQPQPAAKPTKAPAPTSGDLFGGPTQGEHLDALERQRDAARNGLGHDAVAPSQGAGELFAGGRPDQAEIPSSPADPFDHQAGPRRVRNAQVDTWRPGAAQIHTGTDALAALAPLRRNAQEVMAALVLDHADHPLALVRLTRGGVAETSVDHLSLLGGIADVPGAAKVWLAHNHPSGEANPSQADEAVTQQVGAILRGSGIELAGHVVVGAPGKGAVMTPSEHTGRPVTASHLDHPPLNRAGPSAPTVPVLERQLTPNRPAADAPRIASPDEAVTAMRQANPEGKTGLLLLDTQNRVLGFLPIEDATTLRTGDPRTGFARLVRAAHQQNASAVIVSDGAAVHDRTGVGEGGQNLTRAAKAAGLRVLDVLDPHGESLAKQGMVPGDNPLAFRSEGAGAEIPAQVRSELEQALGKGAVDTLTRSGLLTIERAADGTTQATWDGQRITAFEGAVPRGQAFGVLLHEASHARLEEILGPDGWAKAQRDYEKLLAGGDATARAAEARVTAADVHPEDRAQERLAYLVEEAAKRHPSPGVVGLVQRMLSSFRRWAATSPVFRALERVGIKAPALKPIDFVGFAHQGVRDLTAAGERRIQRDQVVADLKAERRRTAPNFGLRPPPRPLPADHPLLRDTRDLTGRDQLRADIVGQHFQGKLPAPADRKPIAWMMGGGGASGKGTLLEALEARGEIGEGAVHIDPDAIKAQIPEYGQLLAAGDSRAAAVTHEESSDLAQQVRERAVKGRYDLVLDRTLGNPDKARREIEQLKAAGYEVRLYGMTIEPATAIERAVARAEKRGRYVPLDALLQAHKGFAQGFEDYAQLADEAHLYDNSGEAPVEIANTEGGSLAIVDDQAYTSFRSRGQINDRATTYAELHADDASRMGEGAGRARPEGAGAGRPGEGRDEPRAGAQVRASVAATPVGHTRTGNLPFTPNPAGQPAAQAQGWRQRVRDALERRWEPLGDLPERDLYLDLRGLASGRIAQAGELAGAVAAKLGNIPKAHRQAVYDYLTTAGARPDAIADLGVRMAAQDAKLLIDKVGDALVARGLIPPEAREKYRDAYLPRLYFAHLLKGDAWRSFGAGKGLSDQGYRKARNDEIPEEVRRVALGEVKDPAFLAAVAIAKPARDMALIDWLGQVADNRAWTLPKATVEWNGKQVTPYWLKDRADQLRQQARLYEDPASADHARKLADELDNLADQGLAAIGAHPESVRKDFKQVPDTAKYGALRGLWVRKGIYEDVVGLARLVPEDRNWAERALGFGGWATKVTGTWKFLKVAANPPSQIRNAVSNAVMMQLSGTPIHRIPGLLARAVGELRGNGAYAKLARTHGVTAGTFAQEELGRLHTDLLDLAKREGELGTLGQLHLAARRVANALGDVYQATETVYKVAKMIDAIEREGMRPEAAAREAQKWLFDYSLVPQSVRYLRNAPVGAPFITYAYKVAPRLVEVALEHPQRFLPYVALHFGWSYALAAMLDQEPDDIEKLDQALPEWMQDRTGVLMMPWKDGSGRWEFVDTGYWLPWTMWWDTARHTAEGDVNKAREDLGLLAGPGVDVLTALTTGEDNFTKRPIADPADPKAKQWKDRLTWAWGEAAPPMLDLNHGALGRTLQAASGAVDRDGNPKVTPVQAALRYVGVNVYPTDLESTRDANVRHMVADIQATVARSRRELRAATPEDRPEVAADYRAEIERRAAKLRKYQEDTTVPEGLR